MRDKAEPRQFLAALYADHPDGTIEFRVIDNGNKNLPPRRLVTRDTDLLERFIAQHDGTERSTYFGVGLRREGAQNGNREQVIAIPALWADIDIDKVGLDRADVLPKLQGLFHPPSLIVETGGGYHVYWALTEPVDVDLEGEQGPDHARANEEAVVSALKQICGVVGGDPKVCDLARILRLPGTLNGKPDTVARYGEPRPCHIVHATRLTYEFSDLEDWLDWQSPMIQIPRQEVETRRDGPAKAAGDENPYLAFLKNELGIRFPIDVDEALAEMTLGANGDASVHQTQLRVSASLVTRGAATAEIVDLLLQATRRVADSAGVGKLWNWDKERRALEAMVASARAKFNKPEPGSLTTNPATAIFMAGSKHANSGAAPEEAAKPDLAPLAVGAASSSDNIVPLRRGPGRPSKNGTGGSAAAVATLEGTLAINDTAAATVVAVWEKEHGPILMANGEEWFWGMGKPDEPMDRRWVRRYAGIDALLEVAAFEALSAMRKEASRDRVGTIIKKVLRRPCIVASADPPFDFLPIIPCRDGALWVDEARVEAPLGPQHRNTYVVAADAQGSPDCPIWLGFLGAAFAHMDPESKAATIAMLQEFFGLALAPIPDFKLKRDFHKAVLLVGPARCGKSQVTAVMSALLGGDARVAGIAMADLDQQFMLEPLLDARAWIGDDAISQDTPLNAEAFKKLVSGEVLMVNRKYAKPVPLRFGRPIMLSSNALPKVRDDSKAVYDRFIVIRFARPWSQEETAGQKEDIGQTIIREELSGVLAWAIEGRKRLLARGKYIIPEASVQALDRFERTQNPIRAFANECFGLVKPGPLGETKKISRKDVYGLYKAWDMSLAGGNDVRLLTHPVFWEWFERIFDGVGTIRFDVVIRGTLYVTGLEVTRHGQEIYDAVASDRNEPTGKALNGASIAESYRPIRKATGEQSGRDLESEQMPLLRDKKPRF